MYCLKLILLYIKLKLEFQDKVLDWIILENMSLQLIIFCVFVSKQLWLIIQVKTELLK